MTVCRLAKAQTFQPVQLSKGPATEKDMAEMQSREVEQIHPVDNPDMTASYSPDEKLQGRSAPLGYLGFAAHQTFRCRAAKG